MYSEFAFHFSDMYYRATKYYQWCLSRADPRVAKWPMMHSPVPTLLITIAYLIAIYFGSRIMSKRKALPLKWILVPYNLSMCTLNLYIGFELASSQHNKQYNWFCQPVNYSEDPDEIRIASALWLYYISRLIEMMDTLFLVLRKKWRQLSFLHIYHHSTMFCLWWIGVKWVPGGSSFFAAMVNSFVHVIMYLYYALAACGPSVHKYLYWKKYLTMLQMLQFISALVLGIHAIFRGCEFPLWMQYALVVYMTSFLGLFGNYYRKEYLAKKQKRN